MKNLRLWFAVILLMGTVTGARGQYYSSGQDPASIRWQQLNSPHFKVIFPGGYDSTAQYVMNLMEYARLLDTITLHSDPRKMPIILHNRTAVSNAQTLWVPDRMDFYHIPPQDTYGQEWFRQLALHEYRHLVQITKLNQGMTRVLTWFFGQQATAAVLGLYVPFWFIEGDAVAAETALCRTGRGRSPSFIMPLRTQFLQKGIYSYDKEVFGSYRNFVPDRYIFGYHFVAQARKQYGTEIWEHTINKVARNPYMVVPFSSGLHDVSGMNKTRLYDTLMRDLKNDWQKQLTETTVYNIDSVPVPVKRIYTNYARPQLTGWGTVVAEKKALDEIARFVEIDKNGHERVILTPGYYFPGSLSYARNSLVWSEHAYDPRWENRSYAVIKTYNFETGKIRTLTRKTRYFSPELSDDARQVAAVEITQDQHYRLVIVDAQSGAVIKTIGTSENYFLTHPSWSADGQYIVAVAVGNSGNVIVRFNLQTGTYEKLTDQIYADIARPQLHGNKVYFTGAWSGINNLYVLNIPSGQIAQVSSVRFGISDPQLIRNGTAALCANYSGDGYNIATISLRTENLKPLSRVKYRGTGLSEVLARQANALMIPALTPDSIYPAKKYSRLTHLFRIHSWGPISLDANNYDVKPGLTIASQNSLSTSFATAGWEYDVNEETGRYFVNFSYEGWYPALDVRADYGRRKSFTYDTTGRRIDFSWMETKFSTTVRLPLNFTASKYSRFVQPSVRLEYVQRDMDEDAEVRFIRSNFKTLKYRLYASNLLKSTAQDMYPRWGQVLDLNLQTAPFSNDTPGKLFAAETRLFFPGLMRHHGIYLYGGYQKRIHNEAYYSGLVNYPRGFHHQFSDELVSTAVNYKFPVVYPDFSLGPLFYLKRIKANLFFDYARGSHQGTHTTYRSTGAEVFADMHILRILTPFELGYRLTYRPDFTDFRSEFLFSINFNPF